MKTAFLEIHTYRGAYVWYAKHYYGHIRLSDGNINKKPLSAIYDEMRTLSEISVNSSIGA